MRHTVEETATDESNVYAISNCVLENPLTTIEDSREGIKDFFNNSDCEYLYVYDNEEECWYYAEETYGSSTNGELKLLYTALNEMELV